MRWFLDMCIVLYYIGEGDKEIFIKKSQQFVNEKKKEDKLLLCCYIKDENIPKWLNRQKILFRELIRQISNPRYEYYSSEECKYLYDKDKKKLIKLVASFRNVSDKKEIIKKFENAVQEVENRINIFLKKNIDELIIPINEIDSKLKSCLFTWLTPNDSDAKTIASAIQEHNRKEVVIITADKQHWTKELLEEVHNDISLKKVYAKLPEIKYIQET